jgi:hypothetical protein
MTTHTVTKIVSAIEETSPDDTGPVRLRLRSASPGVAAANPASALDFIEIPRADAPAIGASVTATYTF